MPTMIKIVRDKDQSVLEQDIAEAADGRSLAQKISDLFARITKAHPQADLSNLTIKIGEGADKMA